MHNGNENTKREKMDSCTTVSKDIDGQFLETGSQSHEKTEVIGGSNASSQCVIENYHPYSTFPVTPTPTSRSGADEPCELTMLTPFVDVERHREVVNSIL